ncbi:MULTISPECIES: hypothetical protein [Halorussus]|uniref:hypothetical protein n=1 Tax=Halorussus TaxID=1070314 RepID=UPI0020A0370E|nr:hypothetical protein [Halorussus vallis]USZ78721.1 hypothetical protein NGM07_24735 [Halorussus vallis]
MSQSILTQVASRLKRWHEWLSAPPYEKRTVLVVEPRHEPYDDGTQWVYIYRVWLFGTGEETTEFRRKLIHRTVVPESDQGDNTVKVELVNERALP